MVVDYSKWDKLELSDDSDVEVHPNVDKKSFIRWKQRDIHEKREQMKFRMLQLEVNIETNEDLLKRVDKLIEAGKQGRELGMDIESDVKLSQQGESKEKPSKATSPEQPRYVDMIESMLSQIVAEDGDHNVVLNKLYEHRDMISNALKDESKELEKLQEEKKQHITADDIHTGWDSTIVYKPVKSTDETSTPKSSSGGTSNGSNGGSGSKSTTVETLNSPGSAQRPRPKVNDDGLEEMYPETEEFGKVPKGDMEAAFKYLMQNPFIVTEGQKDALTMSAFEHELANDHTRAEQVVWNSLLIQYCIALGKDGVRLFFSKIVKHDHPARAAFEQDVATTYKHIHERCKILREDHLKSEGAGEETIQLHPVDPETELVIRVPEPNEPGYEIYMAMPEDMRKAIQTRQLDEINMVLGSMSVDEAEPLVAELSESGVLQLESKIYEPGEWEEKKAELTEAGEAEPKADVEHSTLDDVD